jgi:hypothetical protein
MQATQMRVVALCGCTPINFREHLRHEQRAPFGARDFQWGLAIQNAQGAIEPAIGRLATSEYIHGQAADI